MPSPGRRPMQTLAAAEALEPEVALAAAVLRQLRTDVRSRHPAMRQEAQAFLADASKIGLWAEALGLDHDVLAEGLQAAWQERSRLV